MSKISNINLVGNLKDKYIKKLNRNIFHVLLKVYKCIIALVIIQLYVMDKISIAEKS